MKEEAKSKRIAKVGTKRIARAEDQKQKAENRKRAREEERRINAELAKIEKEKEKRKKAAEEAEELERIERERRIIKQKERRRREDEVRKAEAEIQMQVKEERERKMRQEREQKISSSIDVAERYLEYLMKCGKEPKHNSELKRAWEKSHFIDIINDYKGVPIEGLPSMCQDVIAGFRSLGIGLTYDEYEKFRMTHPDVKAILKMAKLACDTAVEKNKKAKSLEKEARSALEKKRRKEKKSKEEKEQGDE